MMFSPYPPNIYLFKFNKRILKKRCELCSNLTANTPKRCHWRRYAVFIVNFVMFLCFYRSTVEREYP